MIYFKSIISNKVLINIKEAYDCADVLNDLNKIGIAKNRLSNYTCFQQLTVAQNDANRLDRDLRKKYPLIEKMLQVANSFKVSNIIGNNSNNEISVIDILDQDYYGILCDTALKKGIIHKVEEYIYYVD